MLTALEYTVDAGLLQEVQHAVPFLESKLTLNKPTGNFFYDPWVINEDLRGSVWERLLNTLPLTIGEARIIKLSHGETYMSHSDIDNRYHLNIKGQYSFLIDVDSQKMYPTVADGIWYEMDTSPRHVAANFGSYERIQIVVRKLLNSPIIKDFKRVTIKPMCENPRFEFDDLISPWLNITNKKCLMSDFKVLDDGVSFNLDSSVDLDFISRKKFKVVIE